MQVLGIRNTQDITEAPQTQYKAFGDPKLLERLFKSAAKTQKKSCKENKEYQFD